MMSNNKKKEKAEGSRGLLCKSRQMIAGLRLQTLHVRAQCDC